MEKNYNRIEALQKYATTLKQQVIVILGEKEINTENPIVIEYFKTEYKICQLLFKQSIEQNKH